MIDEKKKKIQTTRKYGKRIIYTNNKVKKYNNWNYELKGLTEDERYLKEKLFNCNMSEENFMIEADR